MTNGQLRQLRREALELVGGVDDPLPEPVAVSLASLKLAILARVMRDQTQAPPA